MKQNKEVSGYRFNCIRYKELDLVMEKDPKLYRYAQSKLLNTCPDISDDFPCFFYLLNDDNQIVCWVKTFPDILHVDEKTYPWAWFGALFTKEAERGKGLATTLIKESEKIMHHQGIAWGGVFSNDIALHIYKKLEFCIPGYANRHLFLKSARPFLRAHIRSETLVKILTILSVPIIKLIYNYYSTKKRFSGFHSVSTEIELKREKTLNIVISKTHFTTMFHFNDSLERLIWKINGCNENQENKCSFYILNNYASKDSLAYFVIRTKYQEKPIGTKYKDFQIMTLMDYGLFKNDNRIYAFILNEVFQLFWRSEAEVLEVISNSETFSTIMKKMGMIKVGKGMSFKFSVPKAWGFGKECCELNNWCLTHFCGDGFSF